MNNKRYTGFVAGLFLLGLNTAGAQEAASQMPAGEDQAPDKIYFDGPIVTMKDDALMAEAVATRDGMILAVDRLSTIMEMADDNTERVDLAGKTMLPGFVDGHSHFLATGANTLNRVDLNSPPIGDVKGIDPTSLSSSRTYPDILRSAILKLWKWPRSRQRRRILTVGV